jgi:hypothetical protein
MFNLEQSIANWRRQMLAAGIKSPVPLEELESHLREEIDEQIRSGIKEERAFEMAIQHIGHAELLKKEFRTRGFANWWGNDKNTQITRIFALLWLVYCAWTFFKIALPLLCPLFEFLPNFQLTTGFFWAVIFGAIFLFGMIASIRLLIGNYSEIRTLHFIAVLGLIAMVAQILTFRTASLLAIVITFFNLASLWLLRAPRGQNPNIASK